ncbi:hypothetical protein LguiB_033169 [Lonicera macranthoides]
MSFFSQDMQWRDRSLPYDHGGTQDQVKLNKLCVRLLNSKIIICFTLSEANQLPIKGTACDFSLTITANQITATTPPFFHEKLF